MKYIIIAGDLVSRDGTVKMEIPFIFPNNLVHANVYEYSAHMLKREMKLSNLKCVAAGFFSVSNHQCSGESETLGVKSRPGDSGFIQFFDYHHGIV